MRRMMRVVAGRLAVVAICVAAGAAVAQDSLSWPRQVFKAKTFWVENKTGKVPVENGIDEAMTKWGRMTMADDASTADVRFVLTRPGVQNTQTQDNKKDGTCCDTSYSSSFNFDTEMRAYAKGEASYFYSTSSTGSSKKTGQSLVENFKKNFGQ
jgi:hypothetical protein